MLCKFKKILLVGLLLCLVACQTNQNPQPKPNDLQEVNPNAVVEDILYIEGIEQRINEVLTKYQVSKLQVDRVGFSLSTFGNEEVFISFSFWRNEDTEEVSFAVDASVDSVGAIPLHFPWDLVLTVLNEYSKETINKNEIVDFIQTAKANITEGDETNPLIAEKTGQLKDLQTTFEIREDMSSHLVFSCNKDIAQGALFNSQKILKISDYVWESNLPLAHRSHTYTYNSRITKTEEISITLYCYYTFDAFAEIETFFVVYSNSQTDNVMTVDRSILTLICDMVNEISKDEISVNQLKELLGDGSDKYDLHNEAYSVWRSMRLGETEETVVDFIVASNRSHYIIIDGVLKR